MANHPDLERQLAALPAELRARLDAAGFDPQRLLGFAATLTGGDAAARRRARNFVKGRITPPREGDIVRMPELGTAEYDRLRALGAAAIASGALAFCTMAGGMATRMGGIVKALAEVTDGHTFLSMRLAENRAANKRGGRPVPLWLMTSDATHDALVEALAQAQAPPHVACFRQDLSLRLNPDGTLFIDDEGRPSTYATGHGDLVDALRRTKLLSEFVAAGGKYVWITNVDNLGASIDEALLGHFIDGAARGIDVQGEVCAKAGGDRGGIPARVDDRLLVLEEFRIPPEFDQATVQVFNTNTFLVRAEPIARSPLRWTYFEVEKKVDGRTAIQFERLINEMTAHLPSIFLEVPREGDGARFLPVKDRDELARRRPSIERIARLRGMF